MVTTYQSEIGLSVYATELYDCLGLRKNQYSRFMKKEVLENPYVDESSYLEIPQLEPRHGRFRTEYYLSIRFAIVICRIRATQKSAELEIFLGGLIGSEIALVKPKRKELIFGDMLDNIFLGFLTFIPQAILGKYRVDFFCPELQLCIEYDEFHHKKGSGPIKDKIRENEIKERFGFHFIRVDEGEELLAINHLIHVMTKEDGVSIRDIKRLN